MNATLTTTAYSLNTYAEAINAAAEEAEAILGQQFLVTRVECVAVIEPTYSDPTRVTSYKATVESTRIA